MSVEYCLDCGSENIGSGEKSEMMNRGNEWGKCKLSPDQVVEKFLLMQREWGRGVHGQAVINAIGELIADLREVRG